MKTKIILAKIADYFGKKWPVFAASIVVTISHSGCSTNSFLDGNACCDLGRGPVLASRCARIIDYNECFEEIQIGEDRSCLGPLLKKPLSEEMFNPYEPMANGYILAPGDILQISVFGEEDTLVDNAMVAPDGKIYYSVLNGVQAEGKTPREVAFDIKEGLATLFLDPVVRVAPKETTTLTYRVLGRVRLPGEYLLQGPLRLSEALSEAGGLLTPVTKEQDKTRRYMVPYVNFKDSFIARGSQKLGVDFYKLLFEGDQKQDIFVRPGDYIYMAPLELKDVYVLGYVNKPQRVTYINNLTLMSALASAGGWFSPSPYSPNLKNVLVIRGSLECPKVCHVDLENILCGYARDVNLEPGDIVYASHKPFRFLRELFLLAVTSFANSFSSSAGEYYSTDVWFYYNDGEDTETTTTGVTNMFREEKQLVLSIRAFSLAFMMLIFVIPAQSVEAIRSANYQEFKNEEPYPVRKNSLYRLNMGDVMLISVYGEERSKQEVMVDPRGTISYLFLDSIPAVGHTLDDLRKNLTERLKSYYRYVEVAITPIKFTAQYYSVTGSVKTPGKQPLLGRPTVLSALCKANGFPALDYRDQLFDLCDLDKSFLARNGEYIPVDFTGLVKNGDLSQDIPLEAGDFIFVPPRAINQVFVVGEVTTPATIDYFNEISLIEAIAEAGDVTELASSRVVVLRGSLACPIKYLVDYSRMVKGCFPNFQLQPGDIVFVPPRKLFLWREIFRSAIAAFVGTVASEAGLQLYIRMNPASAGVLNTGNFIGNGGVIIVP